MTTFRPAALRLGGRPLAMAPRALDALLAHPCAPRFGGDAAGLPVGAQSAAVTVLGDQLPVSPRDYVLTDAGIAVVPVIGPLVARLDWLAAFFGATSYGEVADAVEGAFAEPSTRAVLLELDSPGGEVGGLFDLVDRLAALRNGTGKPLWAVASESALSAAYAIASAATRLYVTRTAEIGSVGVVAVHIDESAADAMAGLKWTLIHAGAKKTDGNSHEPLSGSAFSDVQADVNALHAELVGLVARNRGLAPDAVQATEAAIYRGRRGIDMRLADRIGTVEQALADLASELDATRPRVTVPRRDLPARSQGSASAKAGRAASLPAEAPAKAGSPQPQRSKSQMTTETTTDVPGAEPDDRPEQSTDPTPAPAPAPAAPDPVKAPPAEAPAAPAASADTEALRAEFAEIAGVAAQAARLGVPIDAADAMRKGVKPDALRRSVLDALAARAEASTVVAAAPATAGDSPIVRRARERAAAAGHN